MSHPPFFYYSYDGASAPAVQYCTHVLVVLFVHADVLYVCTADTNPVFCLRTSLGLTLYYFMFIFASE